MKFAVLSDTHYISEKVMLEGAGDNIRLMNAACRTALRQVSELDDVDTVFITGDLTNDGDETSHRDFAELLRQLKANGKQVYVLTATHDFHFHRAYIKKRGCKTEYKAEPWNATWFDVDSCDYRSLIKDESGNLSEQECVPPLERVCTPADLWELYREFGRAQAISVCESAYSYCVKLDEKTWCLMLNSNFRDVEATGDDSPAFSPECYQWIAKTVKEARKNGAFIFACTHQPLVPPMPAYKIGASAKDMRSACVCHTLADIGIPLVFSGHTHFSDVGFCSSDKGALLCDITTASVCFLPPQFRVAELDGANGKIKLETVQVASAEGFDLGGKTLMEHFEDEFVEKYRRQIASMSPPLNKIISGARVKNLYPLCRRACRMSRQEYRSIKDKKLFDIIITLVMNMLCGDGSYTPDTPTYKFMMGFSAFLDSVIDTQPFSDIKKKLKGYSISQIIEPMLFNNYVPDNNAEFDFTQPPEPHFETPVFKSHGGDIIMALLCVLAVPLAALSPVAAVLALPVMTIKKKKRLKANLQGPERY
ncbi:MAG: metallophosphoesterase [Clostridiales bacterium]|nr:metallophosphoesterase [Clostridiales bacterium]